MKHKGIVTKNVLEFMECIKNGNYDFSFFQKRNQYFFLCFFFARQINFYQEKVITLFYYHLNKMGKLTKIAFT